MKQRQRYIGVRSSSRTDRAKYFAILVLAVVLWGTVPALSLASVTGSITASRTSGVAPLYVIFDATGSTGTNVTRPQSELLYEWDFDDPTSGNWGTDGKSRDAAKGPVAAHVFETPGTYTVSLLVSDGQGGVDSQTVSIAVSDPNTVFSGTNTICFSQTADFTGAPTGSQQVTVGTNISAIQSYVASGKRLLLHRGQTWSVTSMLSFNVTGPAILGAFGTGAAPVLQVGATVYVIGTTGSDWRIMDLEIDGASYTGDTRGLNTGNSLQLLLLRLSIHNIHSGVLVGGDQLGIFDSSFQTFINGSGGNGGFISATQFAVMGCTMWDSTGAEHILRIPYTDRCVIAHNVMGMQASSKHVIKLHAPTGTGVYTQKVVIGDNQFTGNSDWTVALSPQNSASDERLRDIIVERNFFANASGKQQVAVLVNGQEMTVRNNVFNLSNAYSRKAVSVSQRGVEPPPCNNRVFNNTVYASDGAPTVVSISSVATTTTVRNNLAASPTGTPVVTSGSGTGLVSDHNLATNSPGFIVSSPTTATTFALSAGSAAVNYGTSVAVYDDFTGADRPIGAYDAGAYEYGAGNHAPVGTDDSYATYKSTQLSVSASGVLSNDTDQDNDALTASLVSTVSHGSLTLNANGSFTYTPTTGYAGSDSFVYQAYDGNAYSGNATVTITVTNRAPSWTANPFTMSAATQDQAYSASIASQASDPDPSDTLSFSKVSGPSWLTVGSGGALSGTPANANVGANQFTVRVTDGGGLSADATMNITVDNVNDSPSFLANPISMADATEGSAYSGSIASQATDPDLAYGDTLTFSKTSGPSWLTVASSGALSGTPGSSDAGANSFVVRVTDASGLYAEATLSITVHSLPVRVTFTSVGSEDGYVVESAQGSGVGGGVSSGENSSNALKVGDTANNQQYKTILSFDTSSIPDGATITSATLYMTGGGRSGTNPWTWGSPCYVDIKSGVFNGSATLEAADFQATADATQVATLTANTFNPQTCKAGFTGGLAYISVTGKTQLRVYMATATNANSTADTANFFPGEYTITAYRPVLAVQYSQ